MSLFQTSVANVPIAEIDITDERFLLRFARAPDPSLCDSIRRVGILQPVLLAPPQNGAFPIVHGFARIHAAAEMKCPRVPARLAEPDATDADLLHAAIDSHIMERGLNLVEQAMALQRISKTIGRDAAIARGMPLLGRKPSLPAFEGLTAIIELPQTVRAALAHETVSDGIVHGLMPFEQPQRDALATTIVLLRMSAGASRTFLREVLEVCRRDDTTPRELLDQLECHLTARPASVPETREALLDALHRRRYPALTGLERKFAQLTDDLELGDRVRLYPPRDFEGERHRLEADVRCVEDVGELARRMDVCRTRKQETLRQIFDLRCDEETL